MSAIISEAETLYGSEPIPLLVTLKRVIPPLET